MADVPASICLVDGVLLADPRVSVFDRGYLHGEAVFETVRVYDRLPWRLEEHLARMRGAATRVGIAMAPTARWIAETTEALRVKPWDGDAVLRLTLSRGASVAALGDASTAVPVRVVTLAPLPPAIARAADVGVRLAVVAVDRSVPAPGVVSLAGLKTARYRLHLLAEREAARRGFDGALLRTPDGTVLEASAANVFLVHGDVLQTPSLDTGPLPGVTRADILGLAAGAGLRVVEGRVATPDLWTADEVFLTSSLREVVPVLAVDDHEVGDGTTGPRTRALLERYRALVRAG